MGRSEPTSTPQLRAEPCTDAARDCPHAPFPEFTDHQDAAGTQNPSNLPKHRGGVRDEAKDCYGDHDIEAFGGERDAVSFTHQERDVLSFPLRSRSGSLDHIGRSIDPGYGSASPTQFHSKITITATDIKNIATAYVPHESQDQPTLKLLGNGCSPLCVDIWSEIWERRRFRS